MNIYVGNLDYRIDENDLREVFEEYGTIESENGDDIFVHRSGLYNSDDDLQPEQEVIFYTDRGAKGVFAINVKSDMFRGSSFLLQK